MGRTERKTLETNKNVHFTDYNYADQILPQQTIVNNYKPPIIMQESELTKRIAALEQWALDVDTRLKYFDQKLSRLDNFETQIEQYSLNHLQNNLIKVFNANVNAGLVAEKLKQYFDNEYISKVQMDALSLEIEDRIARTWKQGMDEDKIRQLIQEYVSVFERRQLEIIREKVKEYTKEIEVRTEHTGMDLDIEAVKKVVAGMLDVYDADKTGLVDYALESAGMFSFYRYLRLNLFFVFRCV